jgi:ATP-dependent helicase YprA (DUF1998 family)
MTWNKGEIRDIVAKRAGELGKAQCPCGCPETIFIARCHETSLLRVCYDKQEKVLLLVCPECNALVAKIRVAE